VSSLWTPGGGHDHDRDPGTPSGTNVGGSGRDPGGVAGGGSEGGSGGGPGGGSDEEAAARAELARLQAELRATPVADIVANHAIGLWQLALLHLGLEDPATMNLGEAGLAIDAVGALVDGLGDRLGRHEGALRDALTQLRLAFVQQTNRLATTREPRGESS
jgi:hypothetical protein